ncbi:hypothetical protein [Streptomyces halstedii]|uniref:hypothetical protein n=1 Tax=Streptomyces halstedii TaxID=1944 RepID=UPI00382A1D0D
MPRTHREIQCGTPSHDRGIHLGTTPSSRLTTATSPVTCGSCQAIHHVHALIMS